MQKRITDSLAIARAIAEISGRQLEPGQFGQHRAIDEVAEVTRHRNIGLPPKKDVAILTEGILLAPDPAVGKGGDGGNAAIQRDAVLAPGLKLGAFADIPTNVDVAQRQIVLVKQGRHLGRRRQGFGF